jgi:hypothetical protein
MFFNIPDDPDIIPLPPAEVRIKELSAEPYSDGERIRVNLETTPFQQRPWLEATLFDAQGEEVASASIIEPLNWKIEFTMHVRRTPPQGTYTLSARLFYPEQPENDRREVQVSIAA